MEMRGVFYAFYGAVAVLILAPIAIKHFTRPYRKQYKWYHYVPLFLGAGLVISSVVLHFYNGISGSLVSGGTILYSLIVHFPVLNPYFDIFIILIGLAVPWLVWYFVNDEILIYDQYKIWKLREGGHRRYKRTSAWFDGFYEGERITRESLNNNEQQAYERGRREAERKEPLVKVVQNSHLLRAEIGRLLNYWQQEFYKAEQEGNGDKRREANEKIREYQDELQEKKKTAA
jgi:hypothetical protein